MDPQDPPPMDPRDQPPYSVRHRFAEIQYRRRLRYLHRHEMHYEEGHHPWLLEQAFDAELASQHGLDEESDPGGFIRRFLFRPSRSPVIEERPRMTRERARLQERQTRQSQTVTDVRKLFFRRVVAGIGWAVHTLVFESIDDKTQEITRWGHNLSNEGGDRPLTDDELSARGARTWVDIDPGDYIVKVEGNHSTSGKYLCSGINLIFASGNQIKFLSSNISWRGEPFSFDVPQPGMLQGIDFGQELCIGRCQGLTVKRTGIHLPLSRNTLCVLPDHVQNAIRLILLCGNRVALGTDVCWHILGMLGAMNFYDLGIDIPVQSFEKLNLESIDTVGMVPGSSTLDVNALNDAETS